MPDALLWHKESFALLHNARSDKPARLFHAPRASIEAYTLADVAPALKALEEARAQGFYPVGYFAYELGYALEPRLHALLPQDGKPLLAFGVFDTPVLLSDSERDAFTSGDGALFNMTPDWDAAAYRTRFDEVRALIAAGDIYQANLTFFLNGHFEGAPKVLFRTLQQRAKANYGALLSLSDGHILSLSPELFIESDGHLIRTRPMKGTAPRAGLARDDATLLDALRNDKKNRAENLMIVDLLRNDLGRIAATSSVRVASLFDVETYPTLHQMTSTIEAELTPGTSLENFLKAVFPCGSITGAPKIRAMEIIHALEGRPRGVYCGAIGVLEPGGGFEFSVAIRTLTLSADGAARFGIGSGVVHESSSAAEYAECLLKARFLNTTAPPALFETLRLERNAGYTLLDEHLARLQASARHLGYVFDDAETRAALNRAQRDNPHMLARIRLVLEADGALHTEIHPHTDHIAQMRAVLSARPLSTTDPLLYHKTVARGFYEDERQRLSDHACDEVIFVNERDELTEGTFTNIFIERDGMLLTPALHCGLLPGTLRRHLLDQGRAREAVLYPRDLEKADGLWLGNSLRGLVKMHFTGAENA